MIARTITGLKIRERRRALGLKQNELARRVGISPPYLNLIERNKRPIGGALLVALGRELDLSVDELDGSGERRLRDQLITLAEDPALGDGAMRGEEIDAFIARHPAWARGAVRVFAAYQAAEGEVEALSDRLTHDPVLAEAIHAMLTEITALRSTTEILVDPREITPAQRSRFERIVDEQSARLARTAAALARHFDRMSEERRPRLAVDEAEDFLHRAGGADAVELAAERIRSDLLAGGTDLETALAQALAAQPAVAAHWGRVERVAALALAFAGQVPVPEIEAALEGCPDAAHPFARAALEQRLADAVRLPAAALLALGRHLRWDVDGLVRAADGDSALIFRRVADLHRAGAPPAGLVVADASGATLARSGALDLLPRSRQLDCPVWPLHRARADAATRALVELPGGATRLVVALARPDRMTAAMLVFAPDRPLASERAEPRLAVGPGCRICTHASCPQRRERSVIET